MNSESKGAPEVNKEKKNPKIEIWNDLTIKIQKLESKDLSKSNYKFEKDETQWFFKPNSTFTISVSVKQAVILGNELNKIFHEII